MKAKSTLFFLVFLVVCQMNLWAQRINYSLKFDGKSCVDLQDVKELNRCNSFMIEAWINISKWNGDGVLFSKGETANEQLVLGLSEELGKLELQLGKSSVTIDAGLNVKEWYHVAVSFDGKMQPVLKCFINAEEKQCYITQELSKLSPDLTNSSLLIGEHLMGKMDEIRIWNNEMSAELEKHRYKTTIDPVIEDYNQLVAYYPCDNLETVVIDQKRDKALSYHGNIVGNVVRDKVTDNKLFKYKEYATFVSEYGVFANACSKRDYSMFNKIYFIGPHYSTDDVYYENGKRKCSGVFCTKPNNHGEVKNVSLYKKDISERKAPFLEFAGKGEMNVGKQMLVAWSYGKNPTIVPLKEFTFETWINLKKWKKGAVLFEKVNDEYVISLKLDQYNSRKKKGKFSFYMKEKDEAIATVEDYELALHQWQHVAVTFSSGKVNMYLNGNVVENKQKGMFPEVVPNFRSDVVIGNKLHAFMDETRMWHKALNQSAIKKYENKSLDYSFRDMRNLVSYWKIDGETMEEATYDAGGYEGMLRYVREHIHPDAKMVLSIAGGPWQKVIANDSLRAACVREAVKIVKYHPYLQGIDFDFEWPTKKDWPHYNQLVREVYAALEGKKEITIGLRSNEKPLIDSDVDKMVDEYTVQAYEYDFSISRDFFKDIDNSKIIIGQGLFGYVWDGPLWGYKKLVDKTMKNHYFLNVGKNDGIDRVAIPVKAKDGSMTNQMFIFTGKNSMRKKTQDILKYNLGGMFLWTIDYDHPDEKYSLERVIRSVFNANNKLPGIEK
ncbi:hypothetical protein EMN47_13195 [Prolixibacteraceae bacterium JC049]|nr:hypothetical protein [Prolixibacteraceae bacterium JC049]